MRGEVGRVVGQIGKYHSFLIIVFTQYFVVTQKETVSYTKSENVKIYLKESSLKCELLNTFRYTFFHFCEKHLSSLRRSLDKLIVYSGPKLPLNLKHIMNMKKCDQKTILNLMR